MEIINQTSFTFANIVGRIGYPKHSLTFIIKGSFDLLPDKKTVPSKEQVFPSGDMLYEDTVSIFYSSDFSYFKPQSDLLLVGNAYATEGNPATKTRVTFQVGSKSKSLAIFGNRYWQKDLTSFTHPESFITMELRYENSFGGIDYNKNPIGKGFCSTQESNDSNLRQLPNIETLDQLVFSPNHSPEPAGFAPLHAMWQERYSKLGCYDGNWSKEQWPWFPKDFDWGHFNAAPPDMQVEGYLKGDETLFFENLHPQHSTYHSQLPEIKIRLFLNELQKSTENMLFREVPMKLDTLWVDMETEKLVLVWRGITRIQSEDYAEIKHSYIVAEDLTRPTQPLDYYYDCFQTILAEEKEEEAENNNEREPEPLKKKEKEDTTEIDLEIEKAEKQMRASLIEAGIDPDNLPKQTPEQKAEEEKILNELGFKERPEKVKLTRETVQQRIQQGQSLAEEDLSNLDLSELNMQGMNMQAAILSGTSLKKTNLSYASLTQANLTKVDLTQANMQAINLQDADLTDANLTEADLSNANIEDAIFEAAILKDAVLTQVNATNAYFTEADLSRAQLNQGNYQGADFSKSVLNEANFQEANLNDAAIQGAIGVHINMSGADLTELRASDGCDFSHGNFQSAIGQESIWENANLTGANFSFSHMEAADFSSAILEFANLSAANMKFSRFSKANLKQAKMIQMNLFQGSLEKANLTHADLRGANLYGVEFLEAILNNAQFEQSNLRMTKLSNEQK